MHRKSTKPLSIENQCRGLECGLECRGHLPKSDGAKTLFNTACEINTGRRETIGNHPQFADYHHRLDTQIFSGTSKLKPLRFLQHNGLECCSYIDEHINGHHQARTHKGPYSNVYGRTFGDYVRVIRENRLSDHHDNRYRTQSLKPPAHAFSHMGDRFGLVVLNNIMISPRGRGQPEARSKLRHRREKSRFGDTKASIFKGALPDIQNRIATR